MTIGPPRGYQLPPPPPPAPPPEEPPDEDELDDGLEDMDVCRLVKLLSMLLIKTAAEKPDL